MMLGYLGTFFRNKTLKTSCPLTIEILFDDNGNDDVRLAVMMIDNVANVNG